MTLLQTWPAKIALIVGLALLAAITTFVAARRRDKPGTGWAGVAELCQSLALVAGVFLLIIQPYLLQTFFIPSGSMLPGLQINDRILTSRLVYYLRPPRVGEVVIFKAPQAALDTSGGVAGGTPAGEEIDYIKRCIGTAGDVVSAVNRHYYRNGNLIDEPYVQWTPGPILSYDMKIVGGKVYQRDRYPSGATGPWTVANILAPAQQAITAAPSEAIPNGKILVLGDNRNNSNDGHVWGLLDLENVRARKLCIFYPFGRMDRICQALIALAALWWLLGKVHQELVSRREAQSKAVAR